MSNHSGSDPYDAWATGYSLTDGKTDDDDSDGVSNEDEYKADTNPTNDTSYLAVTSVSVSNTTVTVNYQHGGTNADVVVQYLENTDTNWVNVATNLAPSSSPSSYDHSNSNASGWYRVEATRND